MDFSDDENIKIQEQVSAFKSIIPTRPKNRHEGHGKIQLCPHAALIKAQSVKRMDQILFERIQDTVNKVFDNITTNWTPKKSIVIVLNLKRNQKNDLPKFIETIQKFSFAPKDTLKTLDVQQIAKDDVRDIALEIQIKEDQLRQNLLNQDNPIYNQQNGQKIQLKSHLIVYANRRVTNLSQKNIHVFQNSVIQANYAAIIPTFESFKIVDGQGILQQNQKYYFEAYNNKDLFIQFFYRSLVSKSVMAYLPRQILGLIKMYDYYPISYQQGCNMLIYACQLFDAKCQEKGKPKKKYVDMKNLIRIFNKTWKFVWSNEYQVNKYNFEKLSHVILDGNIDYQVCEKKIINFTRMQSAKDSGIDDLTEKRVYQKFEEKFKAKLLADENLKHLAKVLEDYDNRKVKADNIKMRKKTGANREIGLGFQKTSFKTEKQHFQDKITHLFREATAEVRSQAKYVDWSELNIFQRICPQILKDTMDGIMQDPDFRDVFNTIRSHASFPMARLIEKFKRLQIGRLIYILRCLELKGLIELNKNTLRPSLITNFYDKASYRMNEQ